MPIAHGRKNNEAPYWSVMQIDTVYFKKPNWLLDLSMHTVIYTWSTPCLCLTGHGRIEKMPK